MTAFAKVFTALMPFIDGYLPHHNVEYANQLTPGFLKLVPSRSIYF